MKQFFLCAGLVLLHLQLFSQNTETSGVDSDPSADELNDNTSTPAEVYYIDGEKVTFDKSLLPGQLELLGVWESDRGEIQRIEFTDPQTVIVTTTKRQQSGTWLLNQNKVVLSIIDEMSLLPLEDEMGLQVKGLDSEEPKLFLNGNVFNKRK